MSTVKPMDPKLRKIFMAVSSEVSWLHAVWEIYIQLFGASDENLRLMNSIAPQYFAITKDSLFDELVLILNRLIENAKTSGKDNVSLEQLIVKLGQVGHEQFVESLKERLTGIRNKARPFRLWRNRRLAHHDLLTALNIDSEVLPGICYRT
jgi:AbiU2